MFYWMRTNSFQKMQIFRNGVWILTLLGIICVFPFVLTKAADDFAKESIRLESQEMKENFAFMQQCKEHEPEYVCVMKLKEWRK